ncbi:MAG: protein nirF [Candidatus Thiodiazotropha sp.]|nr:protein nirF [Candidatus Thiodiazotropha sp.]MCM8885039.1 protein nirF [Candidatus Thiodiazotropha sp.]MCM8921024.1 protein nirF [Candidatus Thiodiazotropha sp.]MCU7842114.1 protein nirF [Candidatus Thiodiazotropha sp. (ex Troendleina suluensis)]MCU7884273.1 protein nirF [Candidatus Thiodiazotropha sp. (ex Lucinoma annulata)]
MKILTLIFLICVACYTPLLASEERGTGDLGVVVERADGSLQVIESTGNTLLGRIEGLGDLSHASAVFSRDERYAYLFGRDGGLTKVDILQRKIVARTIQSGNSIGGAISQDGTLVAVSNYEPGGVRIFNATTLAPVADIPAVYGDGKQSKVVGLVDAPGDRFIFSLWDAGEIWVAEMKNPHKPVIHKYKNVGVQPYDALITPDGRYYIAGLYGEDGLVLLDLWNPDKGPKRILGDYGKGQQKLPVYKMPHLEGWAIAGKRLFIPAVGRHQVLVVDTDTWSEVDRLDVHGQPVFVMSRPDGRHVWINFAFPNNDTIQIFDTQEMKLVKTLQPGKGVLHMEFEPRGEEVWVSVRDIDRLQVYDTESFKQVAEWPALKPSGIFLTSRAHRIGL